MIQVEIQYENDGLYFITAFVHYLNLIGKLPWTKLSEQAKCSLHSEWKEKVIFSNKV